MTTSAARTSMQPRTSNASRCVPGWVTTNPPTITVSAMPVGTPVLDASGHVADGLGLADGLRLADAEGLGLGLGLGRWASTPGARTRSSATTNRLAASGVSATRRLPVTALLLFLDFQREQMPSGQGDANVDERHAIGRALVADHLFHQLVRDVPALLGVERLLADGVRADGRTGGAGGP